MILLAFFLAWCVERAHMIMGAPNYGTIYNGFGAIEGVNHRKIPAPMAYRVLVPWVIGLIERFYKDKERAHRERVVWYQAVKTVLTALGLYAVMLGWSIPTAMLVTVMLCLTFKHDYWDYAVELMAIGFAIHGNLALALTGAVLYGFSRETAPLAAVAYLTCTGDWAGSLAVLAAAVTPLLGVRLYVGKRKLYCERWMWRVNLALLRDLLKWRPVWYGEVTISLVMTLILLVGVLAGYGFDNYSYQNLTYLVPIMATGAGWLMAKADEPRVFIAAFPWVAAIVLRTLTLTGP